MYSLVLLAEAEPEKAIAPATISAMPVSRSVSFEKKPLESNPAKEEPDKARTTSNRMLIAQIAKFTFRIQTKVTLKDECSKLFSSVCRSPLIYVSR